MSQTTDPGPGTYAGVSRISGRVFYNAPAMPVSAAGRGRGGRRRLPREAGSTPEVMVNVSQMRAAWNVSNHPYVRMCMNEITKRLFSGEGIIVLRGDQQMNPSESFKSYLRTDMVPFVRAALECIMAFGVVPIAYQTVSPGGVRSNELVRYVPEYGTYTLTTYAEMGRQHFRFYWSNMGAGVPSMCPDAPAVSWNGPFGDRDDAVMIAYNFGYNPHLNGTLRSNFFTIIGELQKIGEMNDLAVRAERISAVPPIVTQYNADMENKLEDAHKEGYWVGDANACARRADAVYQRNALQVAAFRAQMQLWADATGLDPKEAFGVSNTGDNDTQRREIPKIGTNWRGAEMPWASQFFLGATRQLVNAQMPNPRNDLVPLGSQVMDIVCGVLNVPRGMLASDSHVRAGVEAVAESMHRTTDKWAGVLSQIATHVWEHTQGERNLYAELQARALSKPGRPAARTSAGGMQLRSMVSKEDLFEVFRKARLRLSFDLPPATTSEELDFLYDRGLITWSTYGASKLRLNGFNRDQLASSKDPLSKADQRELLLGPPKETAAGGSSSSSSSSKSSSASKKRKTSGSDAGQSSARKTAAKSAASSPSSKK